MLKEYIPTSEELAYIKNFEKENGVVFTDVMIKLSVMMMRMRPADREKAVKLLEREWYES